MQDPQMQQMQVEGADVQVPPETDEWFLDRECRILEIFRLERLRFHEYYLIQWAGSLSESKHAIEWLVQQHGG